MVGKKLPLNDWHLANGAKMVEESGWLVPESYGKVELEYAALRNGTGFADLTYQARFRVEGTDAVRFLNRMASNNIDRLAVRTATQAYLCNEKGGVIDHVIIYRDENYLLVFGSGRTRLQVIDWLLAQRAQFQGQVTVDDISTAQGHIALRGPGALPMLERVAFGQKLALEPGSANVVTIGSARTLVIRRPVGVGDGFDVVTGAIYLQPLWDKFAEAARATGARPLGLAAMDICRIESGVPRSGVDMGTHTTPVELNQPSGVDFAKGDFVGRRAMLHATLSENTRLMVGLRIDVNAAVESGAEILFDSLPIGTVTSTVISPALRCRVALGFVHVVKATPGTTLRIRAKGDSVVAGEVVNPAELMRR